MNCQVEVLMKLEARAASRLAWKISEVKRVDMAVACLIDRQKSGKGRNRHRFLLETKEGGRRE